MPMSSRLLLPRATGFNPKSISGLAAWYDASDTASVTLNNSAVSQWSDKSGNARHLTQTTANNQPSYSTTVAGKNAITFDGTDDVLWRNGAIAASLLSSVDGAAAFYVFRPNSDTVFSAVNICAAGVGHLDRFSDGNSYHGNFRSARFEGVANGLIASTGTQLLTSRVTAANNTHVLRRNKTQIHSGSSGLSGFRSGGSIVLTVGASVSQNTPTFSSYLNGQVCEVIVVAGSMTDAAVLACENYLASKWGVA